MTLSKVQVPHKGGYKKLLAFLGPGLLVAVGYMDPGNWATDIAGGSKYGYTLLFVILLSNLFAILLQHLALKLGIVTGKDLAQACRDYYSKPVSLILWFLCEIAIIACDLAEIIGSALALKLLFNIPMLWGVLITSLDVLILLILQERAVRIFEAVVGVLILVIFSCFVFEIVASKPILTDVLAGFIPTQTLFQDKKMLYIAIGILGATVMPHNLYLHSSIVQTRNFEQTPEGKKSAVFYATIDSTLALGFAFFINAAILITAAATFYSKEMYHVSDITDAYNLLSPTLGVGLASTLFAVALLASGQNSTLTGTLAGQIVMEGFLNLKIKPWVRRVVTRLIAIIPAALTIYLYGENSAGELLVLSQVVLSLQLSFAVVPLVLFTSQKDKMGNLKNPLWLAITSAVVSAVIIGLNIFLLYQFFVE